MTKEIIFIENIDEFKEALVHKDNIKDQKIICLNYSIHKFLENEKINHEFVEEYVDQEKKNTINSVSNDIMFSWYKKDKFNQLLTYEGFNLGWLVENELCEFFIKAIKNFVSIICVIEKEMPQSIIANNEICLMGKEITNKIKFSRIKNANDDTNVPGLEFDTVSISFNIGKNVHKIDISRTNAVRIKNLIQKMTSSLVPGKIKNSSDSILLIDFNISLYREFLEKLNEKNLNVILLNFRKPAIKNIGDLKFVRKNNISVINHQDYGKSNINKIDKDKKMIAKQVHELFEDKMFEMNDLVDGKKIWNAIKYSLKEICQKRFFESVEYINTIDDLLKKSKIDNIITLNDIGYEEKIILKLASKYGLTTYVLQHGIFPDSEHAKKFINVLPMTPKFGEKYLVWGEFFERDLLNRQISGEQIIKVGSPRHDRYFSADKHKKNEHVLVCVTPPILIDYDSVDSRKYVLLEKMLRHVIESIKSSSSGIIVKDHPSQYRTLDVTSIINEIDSSIPVYKNQDIFEYLIDADIVICFEFSTVLLEAMILKKPTILYQLKSQWIDEDGEIALATNIVKNENDFEEIYQKLLNDTKFRDSRIKKADMFVNQYLNNQGNASDFFSNILNKTTHS